MIFAKACDLPGYRLLFVNFDLSSYGEPRIIILRIFVFDFSFCSSVSYRKYARSILLSIKSCAPALYHSKYPESFIPQVRVRTFGFLVNTSASKRSAIWLMPSPPIPALKQVILMLGKRVM